MKKRIRFSIFFILLISLVAIFIDLPKIPLNISLWNFKYSGTIGDPQININIFGNQIFTKKINTVLGLDLKGGSELTLQADMSKISSDQRQKALESVKTVMENRVNKYGVSEPTIYTEITGGVYKVVIDLAGVKDLNEAKTLLGKTARLEFKVLKAGVTVPSSIDDIVDTGITGADLKGAQVTYDSSSAGPVIQLLFTDQGRKKFSDVAKANVNKPVYIILDDEVKSSPIINASLAGGVVNDPIISGAFTSKEASDIAIQLNAGALPVPVSIIQERTVDASLGDASIKASMIAGVVGIVIVLLFMIWNYGGFGIYADIALIIYALLTYAVFRYVPITLTLAGIAGFILSIGMAVDANILIFERTKEELRKGKNLEQAIELGFNRAFPSIRDSNVSSLITTFVLYVLGTSIIKGFALTLSLGVLISLFTAVIVTRNFLRIHIRIKNKFSRNKLK